MATQSPRNDDVLRRIRGEYLEMPGLRLTTAQAQRLWGLDRNVCDALLTALVASKFLAQTRDGSFIRGNGELRSHAAPGKIGSAFGSAA